MRIESGSNARPDAGAPGFGAIGAEAALTGAAVYLQTVLPSAKPREAVRRDTDEVLYVLHGEIDVWIGVRRLAMKAGESATVPRGIAHRIMNGSGRPAKLLVVATPHACDVTVDAPHTRAPNRAPRAGSVAALVTAGAIQVAIG